MLDHPESWRRRSPAWVVILALAVLLAAPGGTLSAGSPGDPANIVLRPVSAWPPAMAGSAWISVEAQRGRTRLRTLRFERCLCLGSEAKAAGLQLQLRADDLATVFLNHAPIGGWLPAGSVISRSCARISLHE
jgi:hypothetical protein